MANWPYSTPTWKAIRKAVLARDAHRCQILGPKCRGWANCVDHVIPFRDGGALFDMSRAARPLLLWRAGAGSRRRGGARARVAGARPDGDAATDARAAGRPVPASHDWCRYHPPIQSRVASSRSLKPASSS